MTMGDVHKTLRNLQSLQELVKREQALDGFVETTVAKLLDYEMERLAAYRQTVQEKLTVYEQQYGLSTTMFCREFREGRLGDAEDFFEWSALADIYEDVTRTLAEVENSHYGSAHP